MPCLSPLMVAKVAWCDGSLRKVFTAYGMIDMVVFERVDLLACFAAFREFTLIVYCWRWRGAYAAYYFFSFSCPSPSYDYERSRSLMDRYPNALGVKSIDGISMCVFINSLIALQTSSTRKSVSCSLNSSRWHAFDCWQTKRRQSNWRFSKKPLCVTYTGNQVHQSLNFSDFDGWFLTVKSVSLSLSECEIYLAWDSNREQHVFLLIKHSKEARDPICVRSIKTRSEKE